MQRNANALTSVEDLSAEGYVLPADIPALEQVASAHGLPFIAPPLKLCTDNAAMIAWAAQERIAAGFDPEPDPQARPRWPLDPTAEPVRGAGVKA